MSRPLYRELSAFAGQGAFNDANSLSSGKKPLRRAVLRMYLIAAELATMYVGAEREFTAFDEEFNDKPSQN